MRTIKRIIYGLIDVVFLGRGVPRNISGFRVRFPARWSRYFEADYEAENVRFLQSAVKAGDVVVDIGAHLGLMTVIASKLAGKEGHVYAFEPTPSTYETLQSVVALNHAGNVTCCHAAVSAKDGQIDFFLSEDEGSNSNSLLARNQRDRKPVRVKVVSLDAFARENRITRIAVLKIDAEGSELDVLSGADTVLRQHRPLVILAVHPSLIRNNGQEPVAVFDAVAALEYRPMLNGKEITRESFASMPDFFDLHLIPRA
jgi:FkbM family methyltransferase